MLSLLGWLNGITAIGVLSFGVIFGIFIAFKAYKTNVKLLFYTGIMIMFCGLFYLGQFADFFTIIITGRNLNPVYLYGILCYMWVAPALAIGIYLGGELMLPEKKKYLIIIYCFLGILFELFIWLDPLNSFSFETPFPGENLIDSSFNKTHPTFFLIVTFILTVLVLNGFGFLYKSVKSTGIIKKKFFLFSIGWFVFTIGAIFDALTSPGIFLFIVRIIMMTSSWFWYLGLKEVHIKPEKAKDQKEILFERKTIPLIDILADSKPAKISEKDITFYREQIICLVCKGNVEGFNFICPKCHAMYCKKCSSALIDSENICWVCNDQMDKTKPIKTIETEKVIEKDFKKL